MTVPKEDGGHGVRWPGGHGVGGDISMNNEVSEKACRGGLKKSNPGAITCGIRVSWKKKKKKKSVLEVKAVAVECRG